MAGIGSYYGLLSSSTVTKINLPAEVYSRKPDAAAANTRAALDRQRASDNQKFAGSLNASTNSPSYLPSIRSITADKKAEWLGVAHMIQDNPDHRDSVIFHQEDGVTNLQEWIDALSKSVNLSA